MKKTDMVKFIKETINKYPSKEDIDYDFLLAEIERVGMLPPSVKVITPLGACIFYDTNKWEEDINVDEAGYEMDDEDRPDKSLAKAKIQVK